MVTVSKKTIFGFALIISANQFIISAAISSGAVIGNTTRSVAKIGSRAMTTTAGITASIAAKTGASTATFKPSNQTPQVRTTEELKEIRSVSYGEQPVNPNNLGRTHINRQAHSANAPIRTPKTSPLYSLAQEAAEREAQNVIEQESAAVLKEISTNKTRLKLLKEGLNNFRIKNPNNVKATEKSQKTRLNRIDYLRKDIEKLEKVTADLEAASPKTTALVLPKIEREELAAFLQKSSEKQYKTLNKELTATNNNQGAVQPTTTNENRSASPLLLTASSLPLAQIFYLEVNALVRAKASNNPDKTADGRTQEEITASINETLKEMRAKSDTDPINTKTSPNENQADTNSHTLEDLNNMISINYLPIMEASTEYVFQLLNSIDKVNLNLAQENYQATIDTLSLKASHIPAKINAIKLYAQAFTEGMLLSIAAEVIASYEANEHSHTDTNINNNQFSSRFTDVMIFLASLYDPSYEEENHEEENNAIIPTKNSVSQQSNQKNNQDFLQALYELDQDLALHELDKNKKAELPTIIGASAATPTASQNSLQDFITRLQNSLKDNAAIALQSLSPQHQEKLKQFKAYLENLLPNAITNLQESFTIETTQNRWDAFRTTTEAITKSIDIAKVNLAGTVSEIMLHLSSLPKMQNNSASLFARITMPEKYYLIGYIKAQQIKLLAATPENVKARNSARPSKTDQATPKNGMLKKRISPIAFTSNVFTLIGKTDPKFLQAPLPKPSQTATLTIEAPSKKIIDAISAVKLEGSELATVTGDDATKNIPATIKTTAALIVQNQNAVRKYTNAIIEHVETNTDQNLTMKDMFTNGFTLKDGEHVSPLKHYLHSKKFSEEDRSGLEQFIEGFVQLVLMPENERMAILAIEPAPTKALMIGWINGSSEENGPRVNIHELARNIREKFVKNYAKVAGTLPIVTYSDVTEFLEKGHLKPASSDIPFLMGYFQAALNDDDKALSQSSNANVFGVLRVTKLAMHG